MAQKELYSESDEFLRPLPYFNRQVDSTLNDTCKSNMNTCNNNHQATEYSSKDDYNKMNFLNSTLYCTRRKYAKRDSNSKSKKPRNNSRK